MAFKPLDWILEKLGYAPIRQLPAPKEIDPLARGLHTDPGRNLEEAIAEADRLRLNGQITRADLILNDALGNAGFDGTPTVLQPVRPSILPPHYKTGDCIVATLSPEEAREWDNLRRKHSPVEEPLPTFFKSPDLDANYQSALAADSPTEKRKLYEGTIDMRLIEDQSASWHFAKFAAIARNEVEMRHHYIRFQDYQSREHPEKAFRLAERIGDTDLMNRLYNEGYRFEPKEYQKITALPEHPTARSIVIRDLQAEETLVSALKEWQQEKRKIGFLGLHKDLQHYLTETDSNATPKMHTKYSSKQPKKK